MLNIEICGCSHGLPFLKLTINIFSFFSSRVFPLKEITILIFDYHRFFGAFRSAKIDRLRFLLIVSHVLLINVKLSLPTQNRLFLIHETSRICISPSKVAFYSREYVTFENGSTPKAPTFHLRTGKSALFTVQMRTFESSKCAHFRSYLRTKSALLTYHKRTLV